LVGSVFSPYYQKARRNHTADPLNHCALNVALYGKGGKRWALTERRSNVVHPSACSLAIGPSSVSWDSNALTIRIDERTFPFPGKIRGVVTLHPAALSDQTIALDTAGRHRWSPLAPCSKVEVALTDPDLRWSGSGYLDANAGEEPLEQAFSSWNWSRANTPDGAVILYDVKRRDADDLTLALKCNRHGDVELFAPPATATLPGTSWRIARSTRCDALQPATVIETLEDMPFYARSLISTQILGQRVTAFHESLSLDRFRAGWVRQLIPFRMPRAPR
jgi:carotenoid 1,2-hydratase